MMSSIISDLAQESLSSSVMEEDLVALSKSTSQIEAPHSALHTRFASYRSPPIREEEQLGLEWMRAEAAESPRARTVVVEVRLFLVLGLGLSV